MIGNFRIAARDLCLLIAAALVLELAFILVSLRDPVTGIITCAVGIMAHWMGHPLAYPSERLDITLASASALPAALIFLIGAVEFVDGYDHWIIAMCIASGFMIGNRMKAARLAP